MKRFDACLCGWPSMPSGLSQLRVQSPESTIPRFEIIQDPMLYGVSRSYPGRPRFRSVGCIRRGASMELERPASFVRRSYATASGEYTDIAAISCLNVCGLSILRSEYILWVSHATTTNPLSRIAPLLVLLFSLTLGAFPSPLFSRPLLPPPFAGVGQAADAAARILGALKRPRHANERRPCFGVE